MFECVCVCVCLYVFLCVLMRKAILTSAFMKSMYMLCNVGNISKVLPDYEKSHVMSLIISHIPENSREENSSPRYVCNAVLI